MAGLRRQTEMPLAKLTEKAVSAFCAALRERMRDNTAFAKSYLRFLVEEIRIEGKTAKIKGRNAPLVALAAEKNVGTLPEEARVPTFTYSW